jgi:hypothetical protein
LYLLYNVYLPTSTESTTAIFNFDTAVLARHYFTETANLSRCNKKTVKKIKRWRMNANESKSVHITFTTRRETCPPVHINNLHLPQQDVRYLGLHVDRRLSWCKHIFTKRKQLGMKLTEMHWLL